MDILRLDSDTLGVDSTKVGIFEERDKISLNRFLQSSNSGRLEAEIGFEILSDLTDETLKWELANQKLGRLLISTDFTKSNSSYKLSISPKRKE